VVFGEVSPIGAPRSGLFRDVCGQAARTEKMKIVYLHNGVPWFGPASGYPLLPQFVQRKTGCQVEVIPHRQTLWRRGLRRLGRYAYGLEYSEYSGTYFAFQLKLAVNRSAVGHILWIEPYLSFFSTGKIGKLKRITTLHVPPSQWAEPMRKMLRHVEQGILLYERDLEWYGGMIGRDRVHFVRYGVDTDFFRPANDPSGYDSEKRILYVGCYLRNTEMVARIVAKLVAYKPSVRFDFLVPLEKRNAPGLTQLLAHPNIRWHAGLDDQELCRLYQRSYLLMLPLSDGGANTAVVESLACGLPIVTTDAAGTRSYGAGSLYPVVENDDDEAMLDLIIAYLETPKWRQQVSEGSRRFAEEKLSWDLIAPQYADLYKRLFE
jgi:glycosyltransferase involved in cell wall biosynthesis